MLKLAGEFIEGQLADHLSYLDAHTKNLFEQFLVGEYFHGLPIAGSTTVGLVADRIYAVPFLVARDMTVDRIALEVTTAAADKIVRMGIYKDNGSLYPGELVVDAGTISVATTGVKEITISQSLTKGWHWLVYVSDGTPTLRASYLATSPLGQRDAFFNYVDTQSHYFKAAVGLGALADPFVSGALVTYGGVGATYLRLASLD